MANSKNYSMEEIFHLFDGWIDEYQQKGYFIYGSNYDNFLGPIQKIGMKNSDGEKIELSIRKYTNYDGLVHIDMAIFDNGYRTINYMDFVKPYNGPIANWNDIYSMSIG